ncbi:MAG: amidohydrolase [Clostridia bacterium]|nr:amidohydrolase [Clostridia bacterium]MBQ3062408.1 amidohydrolase [Clostridia bacterium]MBQ9966919.1 amidohydrolase [Clostridia bacterium]
MNVQEMKKLVCEAIDKNRDNIIGIAESIFAEPELGYKEFKTAAKVKKVFDELGLEYQDEVAVTGVIAKVPGGQHNAKIALMGELDAVVCPGHRCADPETGAAHSCGHHAQIASLMGAAYGLVQSGVMPELGGDVALMAVPAEEGVELEYRNDLMQAGKISFLGGKQEFIKLGVFDDIDAMVMQHTVAGDKVTAGGPGGMGFVAKIVQYIGQESHAASPHMGVNALDAAKIGLVACDAQRTTFKDEDGIRFHPIITKGGALVNVVPAFVQIETFVRGRSIEAIKDASFKIDRALRAGADAMGAECKIFNLPGYLFSVESPELKSLVEGNIVELVGEERLGKSPSGFTTEANDVSNIIPTVHAMVGGSEGIGHSSNYEIADKETAYIVAAKMLAMSAVDLLANGAEKAIEIKKNFKAPLTKETYLQLLEDLKK